MAVISYYRMLGFGNEKVITLVLLLVQHRDDGRGQIPDGRQSIH